MPTRSLRRTSGSSAPLATPHCLDSTSAQKGLVGGQGSTRLRFRKVRVCGGSKTIWSYFDGRPSAFSALFRSGDLSGGSARVRFGSSCSREFDSRPANHPLQVHDLMERLHSGKASCRGSKASDFASFWISLVTSNSLVETETFQGHLPVFKCWETQRRCLYQANLFVALRKADRQKRVRKTSDKDVRILHGYSVFALNGKLSERACQTDGHFTFQLVWAWLELTSR
jgi:hypothetical protein